MFFYLYIVSRPLTAKKIKWIRHVFKSLYHYGSTLLVLDILTSVSQDTLYYSPGQLLISSLYTSL